MLAEDWSVSRPRGWGAGHSGPGNPWLAALSPRALETGCLPAVCVTCRNFPNLVSMSSMKRRQPAEQSFNSSLAPLHEIWKPVDLVTITNWKASGWGVYAWRSLLDCVWQRRQWDHPQRGVSKLGEESSGGNKTRTPRQCLARSFSGHSDRLFSAPIPPPSTADRPTLPAG